MTMTIDKRRTYYLLLDVETSCGLDAPTVYDLGFAITDRQGTIYHSESFIIEETFDNADEMKTAYYAKKIPMYLEGLQTGAFTKVKWLDAIAKMNEMATLYNTKFVCAYNLAFDKRALGMTHKKLGNVGKVLAPTLSGIKELCIWGMACETIFSQKTYGSVATAQSWVSDVGNYKTNAECAYRYITGDHLFVEEHTGLADVVIEAKIMAQAFRQNKKLSKGVIAMPWKIPNKK